MRCFVAIEVPDGIAALAIQVQARIGAGRQVPRENLHLTLAFLGDQPDPVLEDLDATLQGIRLPGFRAGIAGVSHFGGEKPRSAHLDVAPSAPLQNLRDGVRRAARLAGIDLPHERYVPHVTITRFGAGDMATAASALAALSRTPVLGRDMDVRGFGLFASTLTAHGPRYEALAAYPLIS